MLFVIISLILMLTQVYSETTNAAIAPNYYLKKPEQIPFYKSPKSLFSSGTSNYEQLTKNKVKSVTSNEPYYLWNKINFNESELMPLFATHLSQFVIDNVNNERFKVLEVSTKSLLIINETTAITKKVALADVHADAYDLGAAISLKDLYLKTKANEASATQTTIPQGTRLQVDQYIGNYALVSYLSYTGYVQLSEVVLKFDLATHIYAHKSWHRVEKRNVNLIITDLNKKILLSDIKGLITPDKLGLIASHKQKIPIWSRVKLVSNNLLQWQQSKLKDQGLVWWKPNQESEQIYFSIDDLLKKNISSVSFHPYNSLKGLASANGVYITQNGHHWKKLSQFDNYNGPVCYFNDNLIIVGLFRSLDGGKTFENYIQIDKLSSAIELQFGFTPKQLQVRKIESPTPLKIKIEVDTGTKKINLESPLFTQNWQVVRS